MRYWIAADTAVQLFTLSPWCAGEEELTLVLSTRVSHTRILPVIEPLIYWFSLEPSQLCVYRARGHAEISSNVLRRKKIEDFDIPLSRSHRNIHNDILLLRKIQNHADSVLLFFVIFINLIFSLLSLSISISLSFSFCKATRTLRR